MGGSQSAQHIASLFLATESRRQLLHVLHLLELGLEKTAAVEQALAISATLNLSVDSGASGSALIGGA